jgi:hypothetical protein
MIELNRIYQDLHTKRIDRFLYQKWDRSNSGSSQQESEERCELAKSLQLSYLVLILLPDSPSNATIPFK